MICLLAWHFKPVVMKMTSVQVCSECSSHAEAAQVTCDPQQAECDKLVNLLYSGHNCTTPKRAGNDGRTQRRSGIYYHTDGQKQVPPSLICL